MRIASDNLQLTTSNVLRHQQASLPCYNNYMTKRSKKHAALAYRIQLDRINKPLKTYYDYKGKESLEKLDMGQNTKTAKLRVAAKQREESENWKVKLLSERRVAKELPSDCGESPESIGEVLSPYVVNQGLKSRAMTSSRTAIALANIKKREGKRFEVTKFAQSAQKKYIDLNNELQQKVITRDLQMRLQFSATMLLLKKLGGEFKNPNAEVYWRFCKQLSRPRVVQAVVSGSEEDRTLFAQVTVKMHTEQIIALRDRQKRVVRGSLQRPVHATEYIVLERFLADPYGNWRICDKIHCTFEKTPAKSNLPTYVPNRLLQ